MIPRILRKIYFYYLTITKSNLKRNEIFLRYMGAKIGYGCRIYVSDFGSEPFLVEVGNNVTITKGVEILTHDGANWLVRDEKGRRYKYGRVKVGNEVFIGYNVIILPGVRIGNRVIVGAGSIVTKDIPDDSVVVGNPARVVSSYKEYINKNLCNPANSEIGENLNYRSRVLSIFARQTKR